VCFLASVGLSGERHLATPCSLLVFRTHMPRARLLPASQGCDYTLSELAIMCVNNNISFKCNLFLRKIWMYRVSIKYFPDYRRLLQENYVECQKEHMLKCTSVL
jgi:hypothetical protein